MTVTLTTPYGQIDVMANDATHLYVSFGFGNGGAESMVVNGVPVHGSVHLDVVTVDSVSTPSVTRNGVYLTRSDQTGWPRKDVTDSGRLKIVTAVVETVAAYLLTDDGRALLRGGQEAADADEAARLGRRLIELTEEGEEIKARLLELRGVKGYLMARYPPADHPGLYQPCSWGAHPLLKDQA